MEVGKKREGVYVYLKNLTNHFIVKGTYSTEFLKGYSPVTIFICIYYGFVYNLLQLGIFQIVPNHHLQNLEQLPIGNVAIFVHVVDAEGNCRKRHQESSVTNSPAETF